MAKKHGWQEKYNELVRLTAEDDQRKAEMKTIVDKFKKAISLGEYTREQAKAAIAEMGLTKDDAAELLALLD